MTSHTPPSIAGYRVHLEGANAQLRRLLGRLWSVRPARSRGRLNYTILRDSAGALLRCEGREIGRGDGGDAESLHQGILEDVFSRLGDAFALHGACVGRGSRGILISGPSGFGKTTLAIHLALRRFRFLADDLVLIDRRDASLEPVRRGVHLRPGSRALLDPQARRSARSAALHRGRAEWTVDPDLWFGPARGCRRIGLVLLLRPAEDLHRVRRLQAFDLVFTKGKRRLPASLTAIPHLRAERRSRDGRQWRIEVPDLGAVRRWLDAGPDGLRAWAKASAGSPSFTQPPRAVPIGRFQAAIELSQEMVNRGPGSRLAAAYAGREAEIPIDLAGALSEARCYALVPGRLDETVRLVEALFREAAAISPRPPGPAAPR